MRQIRSRHQAGATMLVVLVLTMVMLLGAMALARMIDVSTAASGNAAFRDTSLQASEVGLNAAFAALRAIPDTAEDVDVPGWYWSMNQAVDASGLPVIDWNGAPEIVVAANSVRYVVERVCTVGVVASPLRECLVKQVKTLSSARDDDDRLDPPNSRQYRVTVRVTGPKGTTTFVQSLVTKG
jgi:type IV pilus assembly protein PilX